MKNAPKSTTLKSVIVAGMILIMATGCQNMRPVIGHEPSPLSLPASTISSTDRSITDLYLEFIWEWDQFSDWLFFGMVRQTRTNFTN